MHQKSDHRPSGEGADRRAENTRDQPQNAILGEENHQHPFARCPQHLEHHRLAAASPTVGCDRPGQHQDAGQHGQRRQGKLSDFGIQLRAKQKLKGYYGDLTEKQFRRIYTEAERVKAILAKT